jgi:hypothetical protein
MKNSFNTRLIAIILLIIIGLNAIYAGANLMLHPDGTTIALPPEILRFSPFADFFIPGAFLFLFIGISNIVVAILAFMNIKYYPRLITLQGIILLFWIVMQMMFLREVNILQLIILSLGMALILIGEFLSENKNPFGFPK